MRRSGSESDAAARHNAPDPQNASNAPLTQTAFVDDPTRYARMIYHAGATAVALLHLAFIVFVIAGGFLALRWKQLAWIHIPAAIWGAAIEFAGWFCPLTRIENALLQKAGEAGYSGGFVAHYIFPLIYPPGLTRGVEVAIGLAVLAVNVGVYVKVFR